MAPKREIGRMNKWSPVIVACAFFYFGCGATGGGLPVELLKQPEGKATAAKLPVDFGEISITVPKDRFTGSLTLGRMVLVQDRENVANISLATASGPLEKEVERILSQMSEGLGFSIVRKEAASVPPPNHPEIAARWEEHLVSFGGHMRYVTFVSFATRCATYLITLGNSGRFGEHRLEVVDLLRSLRISGASGAGSGPLAGVPTTPLPSDLKISAPGPGVGRSVAAFSGVWVGMWGGQLESTLVVENIQGLSASVVYSWGCTPQAGVTVPGYWRGAATFGPDGALRFVLTNGAEVAFMLGSDQESLYGNYSLRGRTALGIFRRPGR